MTEITLPEKKRYEVDEFTLKLIERQFTYHPPKPDQPERYVAIREKAKELALLIAECVPDSFEQGESLTALEQVAFWANAGIARNE